MSFEIFKKKLLKKFENYEYNNKEYIGNEKLKIFKRIIKINFKYIKYLLLKLGIYKREFETELFFGKKLILPSDDPLAISLYLFPYLGDSGDSKVIKYLIKKVRENDVFYDIGSNYGIYTAIMSYLLRKGEVHSFEPQKNIYRYLKKNFGSKRKIFLNNLAVGDKERKIKIFINEKNTGRSTINSEIAKDYKITKIQTIDMIKLDTYIKKNSPPNIIKLDVEDSEELCILGGLNTIKKYKPIIIVEISGGKRWKYSKRTINILNKINYVPFFINENGDLKQIDERNIKKYLRNVESDNFVFLHKDKMVKE